MTYHNYNELVELVSLPCHNSGMAKKKNTSEDESLNVAPDKKTRSGSRHKPRQMLALPPALYKQLAALAEKNRRPIQWEAIIAIENHLAANQAAADD